MGLASQDPRAVRWAAESSLSQAFPAPVATMGEGHAIALRTTGSVETGTALDVLVQSAGLPGAGAGVVWKKEGDASDRYRGTDSPQVITHWEAPGWSASADEFEHPDAISLSDGRIVVVAEQVSGLTRTIIACQRSAAGVWGSWGTIYQENQVSGLPYLHPCIALVGSGRFQRVQVWHLTHSPQTGRTQVGMVTAGYGSGSDFGSASAWSTGASDCLATALDRSTDTIGRMRVSASSGQMLLIASGTIGGVVRTGRIYASRDEGGSFEAVGGDVADVSGHCVAVSSGYFVVGWVDQASAEFKIARVGSAFQPLSEADVVVVGAATFGGAAALVVDPGGRLYIYVEQTTLLTGGAWFSTDAGGSWTGVHPSHGAHWSPAGAGGGPTKISAVWDRNRVAIVGNHVGAGSAYSAVSVAYLGGHSTLTIPQRTGNPDPIEGAGYSYIWSPWFSLASIFSEYLGSGVSTSVTADAVQRTDGSGGAFTAWTKTGAARTDETRLHAVAETEAGTASYQVVASDGVSSHGIRAEVSTTELKVYDPYNPSTAKATISLSGELEIMIAAGKPSIAYGAVWYRAYTAAHDREWIEAWSGTVSDGGAGPGSQEMLLSLAAASVVSHRLIQVAFGNPTSIHDRFGDGLVGGVANPGDLRAIRLGSLPTYLDDGVFASCVDGPLYRGQSWQVNPVYQRGADLADVRVYPSPRDLWSTDKGVTSVQKLAMSLGSTAEPTLSPVWVGRRWGNTRDLTLAWHDGTSWGSEIDLDDSVSVAFSRSGDTVTPAPVATTSTTQIYPGELVGGYLESTTDGTTSKIVANTGGTVVDSTSETWRPIQIQIADSDGWSSSGSCRIIWPSSVFVLSGANVPATAKGYRLTFRGGSSAAPPEGFLQNKVMMGPAVVLGHKHGRDTVRRWVPNADDVRLRNGYRRRLERGPVEEVVELSWANSIMHSKAARGTGNPGALLNNSAPVDMSGLTPWEIVDAVRRWASEGVPILYVPYIPRDVSLAVYGFQRLRGAAYGTIEGEVGLEHAGYGTEQVDDALRLRGLTIRTLA